MRVYNEERKSSHLIFVVNVQKYGGLTLKWRSSRTLISTVIILITRILDTSAIHAARN